MDTVDYLFIRFVVQNQNALFVEWMLQQKDGQIIKAPEKAAASEALFSDIVARNVVVFIPSEPVLVTKVSVPDTRSHYLTKMLPYLVEDVCVNSIEQNHVVLFDVQEQQKTALLGVINHQEMNYWLNICKDFHIKPKVILPDVFLLPEDTQFNENERVLMYAQSFMGATRKEYMTHLMADKEFPKNVLTETTTSLLSLKDLPALIAKQKNLLQGMYQGKNSSLKMPHIYKICGISMTLIMVGWLAIEYGYYRWLTNKNISLENTISTLAKQISGKELLPPSIDIRYLAQQKLQTVQKFERENDFLTLLSGFSEIKKSFPEITLQSLSYRSNNLTLELNANNLNALERMINQLKAKHYTVKETTSLKDKQVHATLILSR